MATNYYFTEKPEAKSQERELKFKFNGEDFSFISDNAVFSKDRIDMGSKLLLEAYFNELPTLKAFDKATYEQISRGKKLDLGCGYGVLGLVVQKFFPEGSILLTDVNERALHLSKKNISRNNIKNAKVRKSDGFKNIQEDFDLIITNPPIRTGKDKVHELLIDAKKHLKANGVLVAVIGKKQGASSYGDFLEELFPTYRIILKKKGYTVFFCQTKEA